MWVSATTASVGTQAQTVTVSGNQAEQPKDELTIQDLALLLNTKHRNTTFKGYSADSTGGSYEGL